jgi:hypothetical protein
VKHQFEHEHHNRQEKTQNPDYRERFCREGGNFERGGHKNWFVRVTRQGVAFNTDTMRHDDSMRMIHRLDHVRFVLNGHVGTPGQLRKHRDTAEALAERLEMTHRSILRALVVEVSYDPKRKRDFPVLSFRCFLKPETPFPSVIFLRWLAFHPEVVAK